MDWKAMAKELRFVQGLSWLQIADSLKDNFPGLTQHQILEKVRTFIRNTDEYKNEKFAYTGNEQFNYKFDKPIHIYILGDWHLGSAKTDEKEIVKYLKKIQYDPVGYAICIGDLCENATQNSKGDIFGQTLSPQKQKQRVMELLYPIKDKILFMSNANHEERTYRTTGQDIMYDIAVGIGCLNKYNFTHGFIHISIGTKKFNLYATHNLGKSEIKLKNKAKSFVDVDLLIGGHIHEPKVINVIQKNSNGKTREIKVVICRGWNVEEHYAISGAYDPVSLINPEIYIGEDIKVVH